MKGMEIWDKEREFFYFTLYLLHGTVFSLNDIIFFFNFFSFPSIYVSFFITLALFDSPLSYWDGLMDGSTLRISY